MAHGTIWVGGAHSSASISHYLMLLLCSTDILAANSSKSNAARHQSSSFCRNMARLLVTAMHTANYYKHHIHGRVKNIDTVTDKLTARKDFIGLDDGSHRLILLRPSPTDRSSPSLSIITKTV